MKGALALINPEREKELERRYQRLLQTASQEGTTLGEELIRLQAGDDFVKATATLPIEAVAFAAKDAVKRLKKHDEAFREEASFIVVQGLAQGQGAQRVATQLRQRLGVAKGKAETIARTEIINAQDSATRANYKGNGVRYYQRIATQDSRLCPHCAARAGQVYPVEVQISLHPNDRCYAAPFSPDWEETGAIDKAWIHAHAKAVQQQAQPEQGAAPFERMAGIAAAKPVWTPKDGWVDKEAQQNGQNWALGALGLALLLRRNQPPDNRRPDDPGQPDDPGRSPEDQNRLLEALVIGAAIAGVTIGSYYLARSRYRAGFRRSAQMAEEMIANIDIGDPLDNEQITFVVGGFAGMKGQSGLKYAPTFGDIMPGHHVVGVPNSASDVGPGIMEDPIGNIAQNWSGVVKTAMINGRNEDAIRMAATAAAYYRKYGRPVNMIGYSNGGMIVSEAHELLNLMGVPVKTATVGTPWFGFTDLPPDEMVGFIGDGDVFASLPIQNRLQINGVSKHWLEGKGSYLDNQGFVNELNAWFDLPSPSSQREKGGPTLPDGPSGQGRKASDTADDLARAIETEGERKEEDKNPLSVALEFGAKVARYGADRYYQARSRVRNNYGQSARMAAEMAAEFADLADIDLEGADQITLAIGGFNNLQGQAGLEQAKLYQEFLKTHKVVGITNPNFETSYDTATQPLQKVADIIAKSVDVAFLKARNPDAVRMAAASIAFYEKHGKWPNLIGYSGGGLVVREAHEILKAYGAANFRSISVASPWLGFENLSADEHIDIMNSQDLFASVPQHNGVKLKAPGKMDAVTAHELEPGYLSNPEFKKTVRDFFGDNPAMPRQPVPNPPMRREDLETLQQQMLIDLLPQIQLLSEAEIKQLPGPIAQRILEARRSNALVKAQTTAIELQQARAELARVTEELGLGLGPVNLGRAVIERLALLPAKDLDRLPGTIRQQIEGFKARAALPPSPPTDIVLAEARGELVKLEEELGLGLGPINLGRAVIERLALLPEDELTALPGTVLKQIEGVKQQLLTGRLEAKQLPGIPDLKALPGYDALLALPGVEDQVKGLLRGELPRLALPPAAFEDLSLSQREELALVQRTAQQIYKQARSVERGMSRLASFRLQQSIAQINRQNLPPGQKLAALRQAVFDEVTAIANPVRSQQPPGTAKAEDLIDFEIGGIKWHIPEPKAGSPSMDLVRKLAELGLPDELTRQVENIYISRQRNAGEDYWRKKLKLITAPVNASVNFEDRSITLYRGKGKTDEAIRQMAYLYAYEKWGRLEPPEGSYYRLAMLEGRPSTAYALAGPAQDWADSVKEFFLDPDHLKKFAPRRYEAIARLLNYRHPEKPIPPENRPPDTRSPEIVDEVRRRNQELADQVRAQREEARAVASQQRSTKKVQQAVNRIDAPQAEATIANGVTQARNQEESLRVLEQQVVALEQRGAQLLNPFNKPYFSEVPAQVRGVARQLKSVGKGIADLERTAATAGRVRQNVAELRQTLETLSSRKDAAKVTGDGQKITEAVVQLQTDFDRLEQELVNLPRSAERTQALQDMQRLKAAVRSQSGGTTIADLHRQALQPRIDQLTQLAEQMEALQQRATTNRDRLVELQRRLGKLPMRMEDLSPELQDQYNAVKRTRNAQGRLPEQVSGYRALREKYLEQLAEKRQQQQAIVDSYDVQRQAAINNTQAIIESRLQRISDNFTVLSALQPGTVAWLVDRRNWESGTVPADLAMVLANQPGRSRVERLQALADEMTERLATINGAIGAIEQRLNYPNEASQQVLDQINRDLADWTKIRDGLAETGTMSDRQLRALAKDPSKARAIDVVRYGNQLASELDQFNQDFVKLLLNDETVDPKVIIDQSEMYRRAREGILAETAETRSGMAAEIEDALAVGEILRQRIARDQAQELVFEVDGKVVTAAQLKTRLAEAKQSLGEYLSLQEVQAQVQENRYIDEGREAQRQREAQIYQARQERRQALKDELAEVGREIQKRREAAERGQKRGIATARLEAQQRRILKDIEKLAEDDARDEQDQ